MQPVDVASIPQLNGIFAPINSEIDAGPLETVAGAIPRDLVGVFLRNGPNSRFTPLGSYTYPLDGDGMLHAIEIAEGRARYRNRYVRTPALAAEERAGRALWGGILTPHAPTEAEVGPELAGKDKDLPDIHVIRHGGRYLALAESARPYCVARDLTTVGPWDFGGQLAAGICAHPKIDPVTGEMVVFRYGLTPPYLTWAAVDRDGVVSHPETAIAVERPCMIHDCAMTERFLVLFVCPVVFDLSGATAAILQWRPELGTRIALVPRTRPTEPVRWIETDAFWVWHFANAFETAAADGSTTVVVDYPQWSHLGMGQSEPARGGMVRARIDVARGSVRIDHRDDDYIEFPRIDERRAGRPYRWRYVASKDTGARGVAYGEWNELRRYDVETGQVVVRATGSLRPGEPVFAPAGAAEDDGYVMTIATDAETLESYFLILHAADIAGAPAATLRIPQRVPSGLHGCWAPGRD